MPQSLSVEAATEGAEDYRQIVDHDSRQQLNAADKVYTDALTSTLSIGESKIPEVSRKHMKVFLGLSAASFVMSE